LRELIHETSGPEQEWHCERLAQFTGGVLTVEVSGESPQETQQLEWLTAGAMHAGRALVGDGYVPGGGVAYLRGAHASFEGPAGQALRWALEEPVRTLLAGAGLDVKGSLASLRSTESLGLDVVQKLLLPWRIEGPIDPTRVVRTVIDCAVESALRTFPRCSAARGRT
jgi:chaperonin GroEL